MLVVNGVMVVALVFGRVLAMRMLGPAVRGVGVVDDVDADGRLASPHLAHLALALHLRALAAHFSRLRVVLPQARVVVVDVKGCLQPDVRVGRDGRDRRRRVHLQQGGLQLQRVHYCRKNVLFSLPSTSSNTFRKLLLKLVRRAEERDRRAPR